MSSLLPDVVPLRRVTLAEYRDWTLELLGGVPSVGPLRLDNIPSPEDELRELLADMLPGDELWLCRSRVFEPGHLIGNEGIGLVRGGRTIRYKVVVHY